MTAQGEDILAFLDAAITRRVDAALKTLDIADRAEARRGRTPTPWVFVSNPNTVVGEIRDADAGIIRVRSTWPAEGEHIALNDPASVLRCCAADRKLLAMYRALLVDAPRSHYADAGDLAMQQERTLPALNILRPVLLALAEGYGWTEGKR